MLWDLISFEIFSENSLIFCGFSKNSLFSHCLLNYLTFSYFPSGWTTWVLTFRNAVHIWQWTVQKQYQESTVKNSKNFHQSLPSKPKSFIDINTGNLTVWTQTIAFPLPNVKNTKHPNILMAAVISKTAAQLLVVSKMYPAR